MSVPRRRPPPDGTVQLTGRRVDRDVRRVRAGGEDVRGLKARLRGEGGCVARQLGPGDGALAVGLGVAFGVGGLGRRCDCGCGEAGLRQRHRGRVSAQVPRRVVGGLAHELVGGERDRRSRLRHRAAAEGADARR